MRCTLVLGKWKFRLYEATCEAEMSQLISKFVSKTVNYIGRMQRKVKYLIYLHELWNTIFFRDLSFLCMYLYLRIF